MAKPFVTWTVSDDETYKLVLETPQICELEEKFGGKNLLNYFGGSGTGVPALKIMMLVTQAAMTRFNHGMKLSDVYGAFDRYVENGGSQIDFYTNVYAQIFQVSGFFPKDEAEKTATAAEA